MKTDMVYVNALPRYLPKYTEETHEERVSVSADIRSQHFANICKKRQFMELANQRIIRVLKSF
jgi:hypothetical protein